MASPLSADSPYVQEPAELRREVARMLALRSEAVVGDVIAVLPFAGTQGMPSEDRTRLAQAILDAMIDATGSGALDPRSARISDLHQLAEARSIAVGPLFGLVYLIERAALDELALAESIGATSEPWPSVAQIVRRSSVHVLAAFAEYLQRHPGTAATTDPLTTLHTPPVFMAALEKEIQRAERFGRPFAVIMLDVDRLADINAKHGYGAGDRVLERIGIIVRNYFRVQDWVARLTGDTFALLLPETQSEPAEQLAERVRVMVEQRLELRDYRSEEHVPVTVSVGLLVAGSVDQTTRADSLLQHAKEAVQRAKQAGRNRVERTHVNADKSPQPPRDMLQMD